MLEQIQDPKKRAYFQRIKYQPIEKAIPIHNSKAQIILLIAGNRASKTTICVKEAGYLLLQPKKNIWVVGVDYGKTHRFIFGAGKAKGVLDDLVSFYPNLIESYSKSRHRLTLKNRSVIQGKSVLKEQTFVAEPVDLIVCEDAVDYPSGFYETYIRPRVIDTGGRILVNSIPPFDNSKENLVSTLIAHSKVNKDREVYQWSTEDNPFVDKSEILKLRLDLPPSLQKIIIEGQIPESNISLFGNIREQIHSEPIDYIQGHIYQAGVDIGWTNNRTVLAISDLTDSKLVLLEILPKGLSDSKIIFDKILAYLEKYNFPLTYWDMTGAGNIFYELSKGYNFIKPVLIRNRNERNQLINSLISAFAKGYRILNNKTLIDELENLTIVNRMGYYLYRPKSGYNDDTIMALAMSLIGFSDKITKGKTEFIKSINYFLTQEEKEDIYQDYIEIT